MVVVVTCNLLLLLDGGSYSRSHILGSEGFTNTSKPVTSMVSYSFCLHPRLVQGLKSHRQHAYASAAPSSALALGTPMTEEMSIPVFCLRILATSGRYLAISF